MAEGDRHHVDFAPFRREMRRRRLRHLDLWRLQQADAGKEISLPLTSGGHSHFGGADI